MDTVAAGALGLFATGSIDGQGSVWYSTDGQHWQSLHGADNAIDQFKGAVVNDILSTPNGVFAGGSFDSGDRLAAGLWYSSDGIHWSAVHNASGTSFGSGDNVITSLVDVTETGNSEPGTPGPTGILAVGGVRTGPTWQPASWISPNGLSWSQTSESFPLDAEPSGSPGALAFAATGADGRLLATGGSPGRQRVWQSGNGLAWTEVALPAAAAGAQGWHLGLIASSGHTTVVADNLPGQPYVLVHQDGSWLQPSAKDVFGRPLATAVPSLVDDGGTLTMSVQISDPGQSLGHGTTSVAVLTSTNGKSWRTVSTRAFDGSTVNQLAEVPRGLLAVGSVPLRGPGGRGWTGAFASLSPNGGATWPDRLINPVTLGGPSRTEVQATTTSTSTSTSKEATTSGTASRAVAAAGSDGTSADLPGPVMAVAAGRVGDAQYVVGEAGPEAVGWFSADGSAWQPAQPLDTTPQLGTEQLSASCGAGNSAVVVGSIATTRRGSQPSAWVSTDGSSWTSATFTPSPVAGSFTSVEGCLWTGNGFIAYGGSTGSGQAEQPALWSSGDGATWQQLAATFTGTTGKSATGIETAPLDGIAIGTSTWLGSSGKGDLPSELWPAPVGGAAGTQFTPAGLWSSVDAGGTWQQVSTALPVFTGNVYAQADAAAYVGQQPVVVGTVDGQLRIWVGTPALATGS
jgi:hypothetical protein